MSSVLRDLWPDDIKSEEVISPEEILKYQARLLEEKTNGLLAGDVVKHENEDRIVLGFEVVAVRADARARLFEVHHRREYEYPAAIIPPDEKLPEFLKERVYHPSVEEVSQAVERMMGSGDWVENQWIASSPGEFSKKVETVLASAVVKAVVLSLLSRSKPSEPDERGATP